MNYLPREVERPHRVKPVPPIFLYSVFCLTTLKGEKNTSPGSQIHDNQEAFYGTLPVCRDSHKRRIEQLPEVAMVDVTGVLKRQLQIVPDIKLLRWYRSWTGSRFVIQYRAEAWLSATLLRITSSFTLPYCWRCGKHLYTKSDRIFQLKDLAKISIVPEKRPEPLYRMGKRLCLLLSSYGWKYGQYEGWSEEVTTICFHIRILNHVSEIKRNRWLYDIKPETNLRLGFCLSVSCRIVPWNIKSPAVIGLSMVVSLVVSYFSISLKCPEYYFHIRSDIGSGYDDWQLYYRNENIMQYRAREIHWKRPVPKEVITPDAEFNITTICRIVPLVFMSGIAGAIFDQAFAVTVGLLVSYFTGIMLLPYYTNWV